MLLAKPARLARSGGSPGALVIGTLAAAATISVVYLLIGRDAPAPPPSAVGSAAAVATAPFEISPRLTASVSGAASAASPPKLGSIPKTMITAGYAPASRVWLSEYSIARENRRHERFVH